MKSEQENDDWKKEDEILIGEIISRIVSFIW